MKMDKVREDGKRERGGKMGEGGGGRERERAEQDRERERESDCLYTYI